jgi:hypothetical protein
LTSLSSTAEPDGRLARGTDSDRRVWGDHNALGNTTHLTGTNGAVVDKYSYDIVGTVTVKDGSGNTRSDKAYAKPPFCQCAETDGFKLFS